MVSVGKLASRSLTGNLRHSYSFTTIQFGSRLDLAKDIRHSYSVINIIFVSRYQTFALRDNSALFGSIYKPHISAINCVSQTSIYNCPDMLRVGLSPRLWTV